MNKQKLPKFLSVRPSLLGVDLRDWFIAIFFTFLFSYLGVSEIFQLPMLLAILIGLHFKRVRLPKGQVLFYFKKENYLEDN